MTECFLYLFRPNYCSEQLCTNKRARAHSWKLCSTENGERKVCFFFISMSPSSWLYVCSSISRSCNKHKGREKVGKKEKSKLLDLQHCVVYACTMYTIQYPHGVVCVCVKWSYLLSSSWSSIIVKKNSIIWWAQCVTAPLHMKNQDTLSCLD